MISTQQESPRRGAEAVLLTSRAARPTAAVRMVRRLRFVIADAARRSASVKRRNEVADYIEGWAGARIVAERRCGTEVIVIVEAARPVPLAVAEKFIRECPHYVRDTFAPAPVQAAR